MPAKAASHRSASGHTCQIRQGCTAGTESARSARPGGERRGARRASVGEKPLRGGGDFRRVESVLRVQGLAGARLPEVEHRVAADRDAALRECLAHRAADAADDAVVLDGEYPAGTGAPVEE